MVLMIFINIFKSKTLDFSAVGSSIRRLLFLSINANTRVFF